MSVKVSSLVEEKIIPTEDPFFPGNLVTYNGKVVLVTGEGSSREYFSGTVVGRVNIGLVSDGFIRHYWTQYLGKVTLEATL